MKQEEILLRKDDVIALYNAFIGLCDFIEENLYCDKCPMYKNVCGNIDKTNVNEFSDLLKRIRIKTDIKKEK